MLLVIGRSSLRLTLVTSPSAIRNHTYYSVAPLFRCWPKLAGASVAQDKDTPVLVSDINIAARVYEHILGLAHQLVIRKRPIAFCRRRWNKPPDLFWQSRILDVVDAQPGVEVSQINQIALLFDVRQMVFEVCVVWSEPSSLIA